MGIKERWRGFRPLPAAIKEKLYLLAPLFQAEGVDLVYLFGSSVKDERAEDLDLAVLPGRKSLDSLREEIYEVLDTYRIDLVNLEMAPPILRFEVIKTGVLIYKKNELAENHFELSTIKEYRDTAHLRRKQAKSLEQRTKRWS